MVAQNVQLPGGAYYDPTTGQIVGKTGLGQGFDQQLTGFIQQHPDEVVGGVKRVTAGEYGGTPGLAQQEIDRYQGLAGAADARAAPQMDLGRYNMSQWRDDQRAQDQGYALQQYRGMIEGTGPSLAALQQQQRMGQANQAAAQLAAGTRGASVGLGSAAKGGGAGINMAQNAGIAALGQGGLAAMAQGAGDRFGETQGAMQGYGGLAYQQRGQDLQRAATEQGLAFQQAGLGLDQRARNDARNAGYEDMAQGVAQQQMGARQWREFANQGDFVDNAALMQQQRDRDTATRDQGIAALGSASGAGLTALGNIQKQKQDAANRASGGT